MSITRDVIKKFKEFVFIEQLIQRSDKILIGISGGIDSVVTLFLLRKITAEYDLTTLAIHINYNLRGKESKQNEQFVRQLCIKWGIPLIVRNVTISNNSNIENNARNIRFRIFKDLLKKYNFNKIALGHNKNDQTETLLLHLFRGSGLTGMKGVLPKRNQIIHPLLIFTRNEILQFAKKNTIRFSEDSSNYNVKFDRNKIRNRVIPLIEELFHPKVTGKIADSMRIFQETEIYLKHHTEEIYHEIVSKRNSNSFSVPIDAVENKGVLGFYLYRKIFSKLTGSEKGFYNIHFREILDLLKSSGSKYIQLPGKIYAIKGDSTLTFSKFPPKTWHIEKTKEIKNFYRRIVYGNCYIIPSKIKTFRYCGFDFSQPNTCFLDFDKIKFPLTVRTRKLGDKFVPLGMEYPKKLKDFFIDLKIPRYERDKQIIIEDQNRIIWVAGLRINELNKITPETKQILMLKMIPEPTLSRKAKRKTRKKK